MVKAVLFGAVLYLGSLLSWNGFVSGYLGYPVIGPFQWLALWGLVLTGLTVVAFAVEVLRDRRGMG